jgi:hypothetical protein
MTLEELFANITDIAANALLYINSVGNKETLR